MPCILFLLIATIIPADNELLKRRLYSEVSSCTEIEGPMLGYAGRPSMLWRKADTLNQLSAVPELLKRMDDHSPCVRYYSFLGILERSDSLAFLVLQNHYADSEIVSTWFTCVHSGRRFNQLLEDEYRHFLDLKYGNGGHIHYAYKDYYFSKANKRKLKRKVKDLETFIKTKQRR